MKIVIAIDSFKGSMTSLEAGQAAADGIKYILNDLGILTGENGNISPTSSLTRAQTAQMLYELQNYNN